MAWSPVQSSTRLRRNEHEWSDTNVNGCRTPEVTAARQAGGRTPMIWTWPVGWLPVGRPQRGTIVDLRSPRRTRRAGGGSAAARRSAADRPPPTDLRCRCRAWRWRSPVTHLQRTCRHSRSEGEAEQCRWAPCTAAVLSDGMSEQEVEYQRRRGLRWPALGWKRYWRYHSGLGREYWQIFRCQLPGTTRGMSGRLIYCRNATRIADLPCDTADHAMVVRQFIRGSYIDYVVFDGEGPCLSRKTFLWSGRLNLRSWKPNQFVSRL